MGQSGKLRAAATLLAALLATAAGAFENILAIAPIPDPAGGQPSYLVVGRSQTPGRLDVGLLSGVPSEGADTTLVRHDGVLPHIEASPPTLEAGEDGTVILTNGLPPETGAEGTLMITLRPEMSADPGVPPALSIVRIAVMGWTTEGPETFGVCEVDYDAGRYVLEFRGPSDAEMQQREGTFSAARPSLATLQPGTRQKFCTEMPFPM